MTFFIPFSLFSGRPTKSTQLSAVDYVQIMANPVALMVSGEHDSGNLSMDVHASRIAEIRWLGLGL